MKYELKIKIIFFFLIIITIQSIFNSIFTLPKGDQTNFLYAAEQLYNGGKLGIDVWEVKPPTHLFLLSFFYFFSKSVIATHLGELALNIIAAFVFYFSAKNVLKKEVIYFSIVFYFFFYYFGTPSYERLQVEGLFNPFLIITISLLYCNSKFLHILSGIFFSFFFSSKVVGFFFIIIIFFFFRSKLINFFLGIIFGLIILFTLINFFGSPIDVYEDLKLTIFFRDYSSGLSLKNILLKNFFGNVFFSIIFLVKISILIILYIVLFNDKIFLSNIKYYKIAFLLLIPPFLAVFVQSKFYLYHFYYFVAPFAFICGFYISELFQLNHQILKLNFFKVLMFIFLIFSTNVAFFFFEKVDSRTSRFENRFSFHTNFYGFIWETKNFYSLLLGNLNLNEYRALVFENLNPDFDVLLKIQKNKDVSNLKILKILEFSNFIKENTKENEKILYLVNGYFQYYIGRKSYNKYFAPHPFKNLYKYNIITNDFYKKKMYEFEESLLNYQGKFIVMSSWFPSKEIKKFNLKLDEEYSINQLSFNHEGEKIYLFERLK